MSKQMEVPSQHRLSGSVRLQVSRLGMDAIIPLTGLRKTLEARILVISATRSVLADDQTLQVISRTHLCGTNFGVFIRGFSFPFRTFASRQYDGPTNPYEAVNRYTQYLGSMVVPLLGCPDSLRYVYLADTTHPPSA